MSEKFFTKSYKVEEVDEPSLIHSMDVITVGDDDGPKETLLLKITTSEFQWVGRFVSSSDPTGLLTGYWACPNPFQLLVVVSGDGFLLDVRNPNHYENLKPFPIVSVFEAPEEDHLLVVGWFALSALTPFGFAWSTLELSCDDLTVLEVKDQVIFGLAKAVPDCYSDEFVSFKLNLKTGEFSGGPAELSGDRLV